MRCFTLFVCCCVNSSGGKRTNHLVPMTGKDVIAFFLSLEGPYKWYVIGFVVTLLTALVTRFIFKTLKWFVIIAAAGIVVMTIASYVTTW